MAAGNVVYELRLDHDVFGHVDGSLPVDKRHEGVVLLRIGVYATHVENALGIQASSIHVGPRILLFALFGALLLAV